MKLITYQAEYGTHYVCGRVIYVTARYMAISPPCTGTQCREIRLPRMSIAMGGYWDA